MGIFLYYFETLIKFIKHTLIVGWKVKKIVKICNNNFKIKKISVIIFSQEVFFLTESNLY